MLMTNAKVYFVSELSLNSEEKGGRGGELGMGSGVGEGEWMAMVVNKSVKPG